MTVKSNLKAFGFESHDASAEKLIEKYMKNFADNMVAKASRKSAASNKIEAKHFASQRGGRIVLPSQYFGVDNASYIDNPPMGTDMTVTETHIRPAMDPYAVMFEQQGAGATKYKASKAKVAEAVKKVAGDKKVSSCAIAAVKSKFEETMTKALKKAAKASKANAKKGAAAHLSSAELEKIVKESRTFKAFLKA
jgi:hypothetical protein